MNKLLVVAGTFLIFGVILWDRAKKLTEQQKLKDDEAREEARKDARRGYGFAGYRR